MINLCLAWGEAAAGAATAGLLEFGRGHEAARSEHVDQITRHSAVGESADLRPDHVLLREDKPVRVLGDGRQKISLRMPTSRPARWLGRLRLNGGPAGRSRAPAPSSPGFQTPTEGLRWRPRAPGCRWRH